MAKLKGKDFNLVYKLEKEEHSDIYKATIKRRIAIRSDRKVLSNYSYPDRGRWSSTGYTVRGVLKEGVSLDEYKAKRLSLGWRLVA